MKKIMLVFGTRPEAIKMAPVFNALTNRPDCEVTVTVTGQHRQMLDSVLAIFGIKPDYDLNIMRPGQDLYDVTSRVLTGMRDVFTKYRPDIVLVHGDTSTSTAAALAAFYARIPVGHVEAGLRTGNIHAPWPEEMNRRLTGRIASIHFAPTTTARQNLIDENTAADDIHVTGNTVIDALTWVRDRISNTSSLQQQAQQTLLQLGYDIARLKSGRKMVLVTGHRRENFGDGFDHICHALATLAQKYPGVDFVYPMHLNPNVRQPIARIFAGRQLDNMFFIEPVDYFPFVYLMMSSHIILTDSGGIQEEAPSLGKPVLVMRDTTERPEAVEAGTVVLVGTDCRRIIDEVSLLLDDKTHYAERSNRNNPYGDGQAAERIAEILCKTQLHQEL